MSTMGVCQNALMLNEEILFRRQIYEPIPNFFCSLRSKEAMAGMTNVLIM